MWFKHAQNAKQPIAARPFIWLKLLSTPERAEAPSPGHRPGYKGNQQCAL